MPRPAELKFEVKWSFIQIIFSALFSVLLYFLVEKGYTRIYMDIHEYSWQYYIFSLVLFFVLIDAWMYWEHRLMHTDWLFRHVHSIHHHSTNPTPIANYSHHPVELILELSFSLVFLLIVPIHISIMAGFGICNLLYGAYLHSGYEIVKVGPANRWMSKWMITSRHHNMHHRKSRCNYGLILNFWDRIMHTLDAECEIPIADQEEREINK